MYRVKGGEKKRSDGWEYSWEYPDLDEHPELDRDRAYLLVMLAEAEDGRRGDFYAVIPIHQPGRIWDKILSALSPARWAQSLRRVGHRGSPRDPLRSCRAGVRRGRRQLPGRVNVADIITGTPPDLTYGHHLVQQAWMVVWAITSAALVVILGWDGPELHHVRAPGPPARRVARDGPPPGAGPGGRRIVALVVRPGPGRGRRRVRLHRLLPERHPRRHAALDPEHADDGGAGGQRGHRPRSWPCSTWSTASSSSTSSCR